MRSWGREYEQVRFLSIREMLSLREGGRLGEFKGGGLCKQVAKSHVLYTDEVWDSQVTYTFKRPLNNNPAKECGLLEVVKTNFTPHLWHK